MRIAVIGGGIGGLVAAIMLRQAGFDVSLHEQHHEIGDLGAGIQLSPNATSILERLGLARPLADIAVQPDGVRFRRWDDDSLLLAIPLGDRARQRYGSPYYNVHRPELVRLLASELPPSVVVTGSRCVGIEPGERPVVHFADTSSLPVDLVIGADGIHSTVRRLTVGDHPARFSEAVAYRTLIPIDRLRDHHLEPVVTVRLGPKRHVVTYLVGRGARFLNVVAVVPEYEWAVESWHTPGSPDVLRAEFSRWSPELTELLDAIEPPVHRWALFDRVPLATWTSGRVTLLGDACHPMLPFLAQGACQAIEDAAVLTRALIDDADDLPTALARYERLRRPRAAEIQRRAWENNIVYHLSDGERQEARDATFARLHGSDPLGAFDWLYGYDAANPR